MNFWYGKLALITQWIARFILIPFLYIFNDLHVRYEYKIVRNIPLIVIGNHLSLLDPPLIGLLLFRTSFFISSSSTSIPFAKSSSYRLLALISTEASK